MSRIGDRLNGYTWKDILGFVLEALVIVGIALIMNYYVIINAKIPSSSMEPTIMAGDRLFGDRLFFRGHLCRYDVVIFQYPDDEKQLFIKRVIGMPGDTIEIRDGNILINGTNDLRANSAAAEFTVGDFGPYSVPEGHYFVMGDNRNHSLDSRYWDNNFVSEDEIIARALFVYYPARDFGSIN